MIHDELQRIVDAQAKQGYMWKYAGQVAYLSSVLKRELRRLHTAIEAREEPESECPACAAKEGVISSLKDELADMDSRVRKLKVTQ